MKPSGLEAYSLAMEDYNPRMAKVNSSVTWLLSFPSSLSKPTHSHALDMNSLFEENGELTPGTISVLTSGLPYKNVLSCIFAEPVQCGSFGDIVKILCRYQMYFASGEEFSLEPQELELIPIHLDCHLRLTDMLMRAASSKVWAPVDNVVNCVRQLAHFSASKELPNDVEDAIVLWLTKVNQKLQNMEKVSPWQQTLPASRSFPVISHRLDDLCDSSVLASTLHYYCPHVMALEDIVMSETTSIADALHNLTLALNFCYKELFHGDRPTNFLSPDDFIHCDEGLRDNFIAFFASLFYSLEMRPDPQLVLPRGSNTRFDQTGELSSRLSPHPVQVTSALPDVKALISDVTKRSFHPDGSSSSSLQAMPSGDGSDVSSLSTMSHTPLLPRRHADESARNQDARGLNGRLPPGPGFASCNGAGDGRSKWTTRVEPFFLPSRPDVSLSTDSTASLDPPSKHHLYHPLPPSLLSKVEVDDDLSDLLSERTYNVEVPGLESSADLAWTGFEPGRFSLSGHVNHSASNDEDLRLETVRTIEDRSPHPSNIPEHRFQARPFVHFSQPITDSSSDLTIITTDLAGSEDTTSSASRSSRSDAAESTALSRTSKESPAKSTSHSNHNPTGPAPRSLQASYTVARPSVSSAASAEAAGYPVIVPIANHGQNSHIAFNGMNGTEPSGVVPGVGTSPPSLHTNMAPQHRGVTWADWHPNLHQERCDGHRATSGDLDRQEELLRRLKLIADESERRKGREKVEEEEVKMEEMKERSIKMLHQLELRRMDYKRRREGIPAGESTDGGPSVIKDKPVKMSTPLCRNNASASESSCSGDGSTLKNPTPSEKPPSSNKPPEVVLLEASPAVSSSGGARTVSSSGGARAVSRRKLFPTKGAAMRKGGPVEAHEMTESYDSFLHQVKPSSCHSTPSKFPSGSPDVSNKPTTEADADKKVLGFAIMDEKSPASQLAKKKEQFLLGRIKKEEELRQKQMEREAEAERKKMEAREQQERILLKKQEEKEKRDKIFKEYQKRKQKEETKQQPGVIGANSGGSHKQHNRSRTNSRHNDNLDTLRHFDTSPTPLGLTVPVPNNLSSSRTTLHPLKDEDSDSVGSGSSSGAGSEYTGPKLYKQLSSKSNRILIANALNHCCLSGRVNGEKRGRALEALERSEDHHFMVLFRDQQCQFRGLYSYHVREETLHKIYGSGPGVIKPWMIESLFKYNSGRRAFNSVASKTLAISIDAITIKNSFWNHSSAKK